MNIPNAFAFHVLHYDAPSNAIAFCVLHYDSPSNASAFCVLHYDLPSNAFAFSINHYDAPTKYTCKNTLHWINIPNTFAFEGYHYDVNIKCKRIRIGSLTEIYKMQMQFNGITTKNVRMQKHLCPIRWMKIWNAAAMAMNSYNIE